MVTKSEKRAISQVGKMIQNNTAQVVELVSSSFSTHEQMIGDHERRINRLKTTAFSPN